MEPGILSLLYLFIIHLFIADRNKLKSKFLPEVESYPRSTKVLYPMLIMMNASKFKATGVFYDQTGLSPELWSLLDQVAVGL